PNVKNSIVLRRTGEGPAMQEGRDVWWHELLDGESDDPSSCPCEPMDSEDLLYLLYTSGTTAKPKGIVHTTAGYLVGVAATHYYIFDVKPESVYWCAADVGWVTGHSYIVYGPLCNGTTGVIYEGVPNYPDKDRWWAIVERYNVDILYMAPTAIRSHMKWGPQCANNKALSSCAVPGRQCCSVFTRTTSATARRTGRSIRTRTSPATAPGSTRRATSGCSAGSTT